MLTPGLPGGPVIVFEEGFQKSAFDIMLKDFGVLSFPLASKIMASSIVNYNFTKAAFKEIGACKNLS